MVDDDEDESTVNELYRLMGDVSSSLAILEESVELLIMDLLVLPPMFAFYQEQVLSRQTMRSKLELLRSYAKADRDLIRDADEALVLLRRTVEMCELRNRLIHDVHEHDHDGRLIRRRVGSYEETPVDLAEYQALASNLALDIVPTIANLIEALTTVTASETLPRLGEWYSPDSDGDEEF